ncbi:G-protein coupled receptor Mth2 [Gryllus bimaculatus]|nr:G-protein coupled receptor Mth2 [Gryllus bimaculatus]
MEDIAIIRRRIFKNLELRERDISVEPGVEDAPGRAWPRLAVEAKHAPKRRRRRQRHRAAAAAAATTSAVVPLPSSRCYLPAQTGSRRGAVVRDTSPPPPPPAPPPARRQSARVPEERKTPRLAPRGPVGAEHRRVYIAARGPGARFSRPPPCRPTAPPFQAWCRCRLCSGACWWLALAAAAPPGARPAPGRRQQGRLGGHSAGRGGEELVRESASGLACVPVEGAALEPNASRTVEEPLAALLERLHGESPPWMLDNFTLESARELIPSTQRSRFQALAGGALRLRLGAWGGAGDARLPPDDFCTDRVRGAPVPHLLVACPCRRALCVRKCCHVKQVFAERMAGGVGECGLPTAEEAAAHPRGALRWKPDFRLPDHAPAQPPALFHLLAQHPHCGPNETAVDKRGAWSLSRLRTPLCISLSMFVRDCRRLHDSLRRTVRRQMWVYENGSALLEHFGWGAPFAAGRWCGETLLLGDGRAVATAVFCLEVPAPASPPAGVQTFGALFLVGACFLLLTLAVYAALPELRAPPHAKALMCHCAALLVASVALACMQLTPVVPDDFCEAGAMTIQFSFLAAFFWLNVLCIDISWAFSGLRGLLGSLLDTSRRKFLWYSLYAWGCPLVITAVTVGMHTAHKYKALPPWVVVPNFGGKECWFYGEAAHWAYFYGPMAALLAANAALFVFTAARLAAAQCDAAQLNRGDSVRHDRSSRLSSEKRREIEVKGLGDGRWF